MTWQTPMQRLRQRHSDKSLAVVEFRHGKWQIQVTVIRASGSFISFVESLATTLGEAQNLAEKAMTKQNAGHSCTDDCLAWEEF
jgi:hypothetical protein